MEEFGQYLRRLREAKKLTLAEVASYLGVDGAILCKFELGVRKPNRDHVGNLAKYFRVNRDEMMTYWLSLNLHEMATESGNGNGEEALKQALKRLGGWRPTEVVDAERKAKSAAAKGEVTRKPGRPSAKSGKKAGKKAGRKK